MTYSAPLMHSIQKQEFYTPAFSQYAEGPAFFTFTQESCPGATCSGDFTYQRVSEGGYEACFAGGGPPPVGSSALMSCQGGSSIVVTFEATELIGTSPDCPISDPDLWHLSLIFSFDSVVPENCVVTSIIIESEDHCQDTCV